MTLPSSSQQQVQASQQLPQLSPDLVVVVALAIGLLLLSMMSSLSGPKGETANAAFATPKQRRNSIKLGKKQVFKAKPSSAVAFIQQPTGSMANLDIALKRQDTIFLPFLNQSVLVIGGAGAGKTVNAILPTIDSCIQLGYSIIHYEYKGLEFCRAMIARAQRAGYKIRIFAPGNELSGAFNVLDLIKDERSLDEAKEVIWIMALNLFENQQKARDYFDKAGSVIAAAALLLSRWIAKTEGNDDLANLLMCSQILSLTNLGLRLKHNRSKINTWTYDSFAALTSIQGESGTSRQQTGIIGTAQEIFAPLQSINFIPTIAQPSSLPCFRDDDPLKIDGKEMIVCIVDKNKRSVVTPMIATFLHNVVSYNLNLGIPRLTPLVVSVDEAATLRVPSFLGFVNQERSNGFCGIFGYQYLGQIEDTLGPKAAQGYQASCGTKIYMNPGEDETAKKISTILGKKEIIIKNDSRTYGKNGTRTVSSQRNQIPLMDIHEVLQMPKGKAVIISPGVGDWKSANVPYVHQFKYDSVAEDAANAADAATFEAVCHVIRSKKKQKPPEYYASLLDDYRLILERLLPLPTDSNEPQQKRKPATKFKIPGSEIARVLRLKGHPCSHVDIDRDYAVPPGLIKPDGQVQLNLTNCLEILGEKIHA
jgi:type IV secretory pathway TraG/TraD family ATPase VirD4